MDQRANPIRRQRCAIYTRKSSEEGLEQEFNSLHAQREACEAYIASQRSEGWVLVRDQYDDGGISGGTLERPGLKQLLADIEDGLIDVVVVYKIDRLSRSLMDFSKLVEVFDRNGVTFVSVTQSFNTTTSMGRLTLNILLSFAQFEREVTAERIRDKVRASRMKGMWMGGYVPLGYDVKDRKLVVNEDEAATVRGIFETVRRGRISDRAGPRTAPQRAPQQAGHVGRQGISLQGADEPRLSRRRRPQGQGLSRRASGHHRRAAVGSGPCHLAAEPAKARQQHPRAGACAAQGADLHGHGRRHDPEQHEEGRAAIPVLRLDGRHQESRTQR